jgi:two-component sensor histidine kinase
MRRLTRARKDESMIGVMMVRHEASSAAAVRRELALDLDLRGLDEEVIDAVTLVASELVGNAVRHACIPERDHLDIGWYVGPDEITISVEDPSSALPVRRIASPEATNGRGLTIVEALTSDWGVERTQRGKRVWAKVPLAMARIPA